MRYYNSGRLLLRAALICLFLVSSSPNLAFSQTRGPEGLPWFYLPLTGLESVTIEGAGVSAVNGMGMRIVGPVIFERVAVEVVAAATYEDDRGRLYHTVSPPLVLNLWQVTARLSIYADGQYWGTAVLKQ